jgi:hypothetical protein
VTTGVMQATIDSEWFFDEPESQLAEAQSTGQEVATILQFASGNSATAGSTDDELQIALDSLIQENLMDGRLDYPDSEAQIVDREHTMSVLLGMQLESMERSKH